MSAPFSHTLRSLQAQRPRWFYSSTLGALILAAVWGGWAATSTVNVHVTSAEARMVSSVPVKRLEASASGLVKESSLRSIMHVEQGELLLALDTAQLELERDAALEASALIDAVDLVSLDDQIELLESALETGSVSASRVAESRSQLAQAKRAAEHAEREADRARKLLDVGSITALAYEESRSRADRLAQAAGQWSAAIRRARSEDRIAAREVSARLSELRRQRADIVRERERFDARAEQLAASLALHELRAPMSGQLDVHRVFESGSVVERGDLIGVIVPDAPVQIEARFAPGDALGRVRVGQVAKLELDSFPWVRYGGVDAVVRDVSREPLDGVVKVILDVTARPDQAPEMFHHGLTGRLEIAVEELTPFELLFRLVGKAERVE